MRVCWSHQDLTSKLIIGRGQVARVVLQVLAPPVLDPYSGSLGGRPWRPRPRPGEGVGASCWWWRCVCVGLRRHAETRGEGDEPCPALLTAGMVWS